MSFAVRLDLTGRAVVVIGGGPRAARQARQYRSAGAQVVVIAEQLCEDLADLITAQPEAGASSTPATGLGRLVQRLTGGPGTGSAGTLSWRPRSWRQADLTQAWLVHAATDDPAEDAAVVAAAQDARVWCLAENAPAASARTDRSRPCRPRYDGPGRVALVGGGPGDPELITVRGRELVREADVLIVDRLGPRSLLDEVDPDVEVIDVGKSPDHHPIPQEEINRLIVDRAQAGRRVVRLKGGDPYVLGRGGEEVAACRAAGVPVTVVPGVTSAFAVPAAAGIPVTHRGLARSVTVITGHDDPDHEALARLGGTIVVLMGIGRLGRLVDGLLRHGMDPQTPVAVVESGWTPQQRTTVTVLHEAVRTVTERGVAAPAVLVIGAVAQLAVADALDQVARSAAEGSGDTGGARAEGQHEAAELAGPSERAIG